MGNRKTATVLVGLRKGMRRLETVFFMAKAVLSERNFIYLSSVAVAVSCALAVIILKNFAHNVFLFANYVNQYLKLPYANSIFPIIGILLTVIVIRKFLDGSIEKGSSRILYAVAKKGGIMPRKQMYAQIVTSSLTVGLGGSAGLESPITITGAAFGSNYAQKYRLSQKDRILLLACGVAAGIGAAFNAPIAGVLFAIEVVLTDVSISAFIPIMISAATGALVSNILLSQDILLSFKDIKPFDYHNIPYYILLGLASGLVSVYHARNFRRVEHFFTRYRLNSYRRAFVGALLLALLIFFFPTLFGEGYESIKTLSTAHPESLLDNTLLEPFKSKEWVLLGFVGIIVFLKSLATGLTLGSGGNGGNFAPSLFVGSYLGFVVVKIMDLTGINSHLPVANFTMVGMAGILSGLFHAPLTSIFLIGEITGGYDLMVPLMMVSSISFAVSRKFEKHSMDVKALADKGEVFTGDKDKNVLLSIDFLSHVQLESKTFQLTDSVEDVIQALQSTQQPLFPVLDDKNKVIGVLDINHLKSFIFNAYRVKFGSIEEWMQPVETVLNHDDGMELIMDKFDAAKQNTLIVLKSGKYYGIVNKCDLLETYRLTLKGMVIE